MLSASSVHAFNSLSAVRIRSCFASHFFAISETPPLPLPSPSLPVMWRLREERAARPSFRGQTGSGRVSEPHLPRLHHELCATDGARGRLRAERCGKRRRNGRNALNRTQGRLPQLSHSIFLVVRRVGGGHRRPHVQVRGPRAGPGHTRATAVRTFMQRVTFAAAGGAAAEGAALTEDELDAQHNRILTWHNPNKPRNVVTYDYLRRSFLNSSRSRRRTSRFTFR